MNNTVNIKNNRNPIFCYERRKENNECKKIILNTKAFNKVVSETFSYGEVETGGVFIGHIRNGVWYVIDSIEAGMITKTIHTMAFFKIDKDYVNHQIKKQQVIYDQQPGILGFWHRHPSHLDTFSLEDEDTLKENCDLSKHGIISMLVNIDPEFRMTYYHASKDYKLFNIEYEIGDELIPNELTAMASYETITERFNNNIKQKEKNISEFEKVENNNNLNEYDNQIITDMMAEKNLLSRIAAMEANRYSCEEKVLIPEELIKDNNYFGALYGYMPETGVYTVISGEQNMKICGSELIGYKFEGKYEIDNDEIKLTQNTLFVYDDGTFIYDADKKEMRSILMEPYSLTQNLNSRHSGLLEVDWMKNATAIISGCGSVGSLIAVQLARSGVGNIVLIDPEILEIHNICRHQLTLTDIGKLKVESIGDKIKQINPNCNVKTFSQPFQDVPLVNYENMIVDKEKTIFIGACDNRVGDAYVCKTASDLGIAFASIGFYPRAWCSEIFTMLPGELEYELVFKKQIVDAVLEERNNHLYLGEEDKGKVSFVPGLDVDIEYATSFFSKALLDIINRNNDKYKMRAYNHLTSQFTLLAGTNDIPDPFLKENLTPFVPTSVELSEDYYKMKKN